MSHTKKGERRLKSTDLQLLLQMADVEGLSLDMLRSVHEEICARRPAGWKTMESSLRLRYKNLKQRELDSEHASMQALAADNSTNSPLDAAVETTPGKNISAAVEGKASPQVIVNTPRVHVLQPSKPKAPETWEEAAKLVRHAKVHADTKDLSSRLTNTRDWAQISPLRLLGYSVKASDGLNLSERREFLKDFCENAILPLSLPKDYATAWDEPGSKGRALRTARHLQFLIKTFKQRNDKAYDSAISAWEQDWTYLREQFGRLAPVTDWLATRN